PAIKLSTLSLHDALPILVNVNAKIKNIEGVRKMDREEAQEFWEIVIQKVQQRLSKPMYDTWIAPLSGQIAEGNTIVISAASEFADRKSTRLNSSHVSISY